ncbi:MAG: hypothetical protein ACXAEN_19500 [Candidatus Thorarchaeota archaeon]
MVSIAALVALAFSFVTATSVLYLKRKAGPLIDSANEMLKNKPLEQLNEQVMVLGGHIESVIADARDEALEFANEYGNQFFVRAAGLLQGEGAAILGKKGREKSLANAQIKAAKEDMLRRGIQSQLPEGITVEMAEEMAQRFGYELSDIQQFLPMLQRFAPNLLTPGGNGPMQAPRQSSPPTVASQPPGGRIPLDKLGT